tara:strand:- start:5130 stop:5462 length:333 start_codon:yes stop_codon:yes gene_type:complete
MLEDGMFSTNKTYVLDDYNTQMTLSGSEHLNVTTIPSTIRETLNVNLWRTVVHTEEVNNGRFKMKVARAIHQDLYGKVISRLHKIIFVLDTTTRGDTLAELNRLLAELEK